MPASVRPLVATPSRAITRPAIADGPIRTVALAAAASVPFVLLSIADTGGQRVLWDNLHWSISAVGAAVAGVLAVRGRIGRVRAVRAAGAAALVLWMLATLSWAWLTMTGAATVPSITDGFILAIPVPGLAVLVATVRGLLSKAEETAVYLDATLGFLLIGTVLLFLFGPTAVASGSVAGMVALAYPTAFIGLAGAGFVAILAVGYPLAPRGAFALVMGAAIIGAAYLGWIAPTIDLLAPGELSSICFTLGTLVAGYGVATWENERATGARYLAFARWATRIVAPVAASILFLLVLAPMPPEVDGTIHLAIFAASIVFVFRQGLLLRERTKMLASVLTLEEENSRLVEELRGELERRASDQRRMVQASRSAAIGELAAGVAHEVNNPLTGVLGYAELLLEDAALNDQQRSDVETIRDEALRARSIVAALRDFASPRTPELAPTSLSDVVRRTIDLLRYSMVRRGVTIHEDLPELAPILVDGQAIQQAILNVLTNANQALSATGHLDVSVQADGDEQVVTIRDDGVGMDEATLRGAFEPFFSAREDHAGTATGLGLSISSGLIESHGGRISIHSTLGLGTTVEIRLPIRAEAAGDEGQGGQIA